MSTTSSARPQLSGREKFVDHIHAVCARSPQARNQLRRLLRRNAEDAGNKVHKAVAPWLPEKPSPGQESAYYTVAALIAAQPNNTHHGNQRTSRSETDPDAAEACPWWQRPTLGKSLARAALRPGAPTAISFASAERHLRLLSRRSVHNLHRHLPTVINHMIDSDVTPDWVRLLRDLCQWEHEPRLIAKQWQQDFYRTAHNLDPDTLDSGE